MKFSILTFAVVILLLSAGCSKNGPVDHMYLQATFNGQPYGHTYGGLNGINPWLNSDTSVLTINTIWGTVVSFVPTYAILPNIQIYIQKTDSFASGLTLSQKYFNILQSGSSYSFLPNDTATTTGVLITLYDSAANKNWYSYAGDNTGSYFTITSSGSAPFYVTSTPVFDFPSSYGAKFSCKMYDDSGNVKVFQGSFSQVGY